MKLSNIPVRFQSINGKPASVDTAYDLLCNSGQLVVTYESVSKQVLNGESTGMYLWSHSTGTGKSTLATALACEYVVRRVGQSLRDGKAQSTPYAFYVNFPQFLEIVKRMYRDDADGAMSDVQQIQQLMSDAEMVVWDDVGVSTATESIQERVLAIIEGRYDKVNVFTSNCSLNQLEDKLGARVVSRIHGMTTEIHVKGVDHRKEGGME